MATHAYAGDETLATTDAAVSALGKPPPYTPTWTYITRSRLQAKAVSRTEANAMGEVDVEPGTEQPATPSGTNSASRRTSGSVSSCVTFVRQKIRRLSRRFRRKSAAARETTARTSGPDTSQPAETRDVVVTPSPRDVDAASSPMVPGGVLDPDTASTPLATETAREDRGKARAKPTD